jgi:hypothetical protein
MSEFSGRMFLHRSIAADAVAYCTLTGLKDGTAKVTLKKITAVSGGNSTEVASTPIEVRVSLQPIATVKLTLDKATYAPNEKATLKVTAYDAAGKIVVIVQESFETWHWS